MKNIKYLAMLAIAGMAVTACDPVLVDGPEPWAAYTEQEVNEGLTFEQCDVNGNPAADGNYIHFNSKAGVVQWFNYDDKGNEVILYTGASGIIPVVPKRGQDPNQTIYGRLQNADGTQTIVEKTFTVSVPTDLDPEVKLLVSDEGSKSWAWHFGDVTCWGNAGNSGGGASYTWNNVDGKWWGVETPEGLLEQLGHAAGGVETGAENSGAYMTFDEDGNVVAYKADGSTLYSSTYKITGYDPARSSGWQVATLTTADPAVLFPFSINEGGKYVTEFDVMYLDPNYMTLVYTKGNGAGSWGEITYWMFKSKNNAADALNGQSSRKWGWNTSTACWGNAGNSGGGSAFTAGNVDGKWWGPDTPEDLMGQLAHAVGGVATGTESSNAYMEFNVDGTITTYGGDGSVVYKSTYEVVDFDATRASGWQLGTFKTAEPAVLFPFSINEGGVAVTDFDLMYIDASDMTLVYTKGNGAGSWGEITYWLFKAMD